MEQHNQAGAVTDIAVLGGGSYWGLQAAYQLLRGVTEVTCGYMGEPMAGTTHEQICAGQSGLAQVVRLQFDPAVIAYRDLLELFFTIHDPTTLDRQGKEAGPQYRSVIFYQSEQQHAVARQVIAQMAGVWDAPIVTQLAPAQSWHAADACQQDYAHQHPLQGYCALVVAPMLAKVRALYAGRLK